MKRKYNQKNNLSSDSCICSANISVPKPINLINLENEIGKRSTSTAPKLTLLKEDASNLITGRTERVPRHDGQYLGPLNWRFGPFGRIHLFIQIALANNKQISLGFSMSAFLYKVISTFKVGRRIKGQQFEINTP